MIKTGYSFRAAAGHLPEVIARLQAIGWRTAPIADRNSTFGFNRWTKLAKAANMRPVYGVELAVTPDTGAKKPPLDYWTFLAIDSLVPLHAAIDIATSAPGRNPCMTYVEARRLTGLIKIAGPSVLLDHLWEDDDNLFLGLTPATPRGLFNNCQLRTVAMSCNAYTTQADRELYRVMMGKRSDTQSYPQHILDDVEWSRAVGWFTTEEQRTAALRWRDELLDRSQATIAKASLLKPRREKTLRDMCLEGAARLNCDLTDPTYAARLDHELKMLAEKKFEDYFYIVAELVSWAKERMIVGPARGSSAGSLVCYLLGITAIDPIPHGLLFERFVDVTRSDLPDIDIDFSDAHRQKVFDHAAELYGIERVARLGTVNMYGPKSIFRQVGPALRIPQWMINKVLDSLIERSGGDTRAMQQLEDTLKDTESGRALLAAYPEVMLAARMEGHPTTAGQHAAGIVLTEEPVRKFVAVNSNTGATMCDKKDAADYNLLKIDALGLTQLSVFERTLELIGEEPKSSKLFLERLPLDDAAAFKVLNEKHFAGVFQFTGVTLQALTKQITVDRFEDLVSITALSRPGPMATGGAGSWARRRAGVERVTYAHEILEPYLRETLGVVTYQEQVMKIGREIGDLSWADVTALRKGMSQSLGQEYFDQYGNRWKAGAIAKGIPAELVDKIWFDLCAFGSWGFNKSHAVAYALVSYWCCWFKAHHPLEFAAATLDTMDDQFKQIELLRELKAEGVSYVPIDPQHSGARWEPAGRTLVGPLTNVHGIGPKSVLKIVSARRRGEPIPEALAKKLENAKTPIDSLYPIGDRVKTLHPDLNSVGIETTPTQIKDVQCGVTQRQQVVIGVLRKLNLRDENEDVNVAKRGGKKVVGPDKSLLLFFRDDTDEVFCKIDRRDFERIGKDVVERGRAGKALYAVKGDCPDDFRMLRVRRIKYLGDMEADYGSEQGGRSQDQSTDTNTGID